MKSVAYTVNTPQKSFIFFLKLNGKVSTVSNFLFMRTIANMQQGAHYCTCVKNEACNKS